MNDGRKTPAKPSRRAQKRARIRAEILGATRGILESEGIAGLTLDAVAAELGYTKAALYYYFKSKDALLFELMLDLILAEGQAIAAAVERTETGGDALEAQIRTMLDHYRDGLPDFRLVYASPPLVDPAVRVEVSSEMLARLRPLNEMVYGTVEQRLLADRERGELAEDVEPRRLAFLSHMSALGVLTMQHVVDRAEDPLIHDLDDLADDLVRIFRKAARR